jgi:DNA-binding NtrC family response regulator
MPPGPTLLLVDDEHPVREILARFARGCGFDVAACGGGREALAHLEQHTPHAALLDLRMPDVSGLELLRTIRQRDPQCQVILMSGAGTISDAVEALKLGARDYFEKPFKLTVLGTVLDQIKRDVEQRVAPDPAPPRPEFDGMIGQSAVMQEMFGFVRRLAPHVGAALVTGASGTGKTLVAQALHRLGPRASHPLVTLNCYGLTEQQAESDLFGHVRGAFPGATEDRAGVFERANGGVLFINEIAALPLAVQGRLAWALEHGETIPIGSFEARRFDVVVLASTRRDVRTEILAGRFRRELFYRFNSATIQVPSLAERREDIPHLTAAFRAAFAERQHAPAGVLTPGAEAVLQKREFRGNVRELRNVIERACILADGQPITDRHIIQAFE